MEIWQVAKCGQPIRKVSTIAPIFPNELYYVLQDNVCTAFQVKISGSDSVNELKQCLMCLDSNDDGWCDACEYTSLEAQQHAFRLFKKAIQHWPDAQFFNGYKIDSYECMSVLTESHIPWNPEGWLRMEDCSYFFHLFGVSQIPISVINHLQSVIQFRDATGKKTSSYERGILLDEISGIIRITEYEKAKELLLSFFCVPPLVTLVEEYCVRYIPFHSTAQEASEHIKYQTQTSHKQVCF